MKRILSFLLAVLMVCNLAVPAVAVEVPEEANTFYLDVDKTSVQVGETVTLYVYSNTEMKNMASNTVLVDYDETVFQLNTTDSFTEGDEEYWAVIDNVHEDQGKYTGVTMFRSSSKETIPEGLLATIKLTALKASETTSFAIFKADASWLDKNNNSAKNNVDVKFADPIVLTVSAPAPTTYTVTLPENPVGYTIETTDALTQEAGGTFSFKVLVADGYEGTPEVKAGDQPLTADGQGIYSVVVNENVSITVSGITEKAEIKNDLIPEGAPFTALTAQNGEVVKIEAMGTIDFNGYTPYEAVPYYHVTITEGTEGVFVTHPTTEDPFTDAVYGSAYGYYADTTDWTGGGMTFSFEEIEGGYIIALPLESYGNSFVADEDGVVSYAVAVERNDYSPICFFTFAYGEKEPEPVASYTVTLPENPVGYTIGYTGSTTVEAGQSFTFTVNVQEGYEKKEAFAVKAGTEPLTANADGSYTVTVTDNLTITVEGVGKNTYTVTIPTGEGYTIGHTGSTTVEAGQSFTFTVNIQEGYEKMEAFAVKAGTEPLTANADGSYTITVTDNMTIAVSGIAKEKVYEGYAVKASKDKTITAGENAEVKITVKADKAAVFNAYDLTVTYDAAVVNYDSYTAANTKDEVVVTAKNGTIRIQGYGPDKNVDTAPVTLVFTGKAIGSADVKITNAKVDIGEHAIAHDALDATVLDDTTVITVTGYTVDLDDGLTADSTVAENGVDYTFYPTDADNYTYAVTYTVSGKTYTAAANADGSYTIPGEHITGNIALSATMTPKSYKVTVGGEDVSGSGTATYNTPYTFRVDKKAGYTYTISVLRGGKTYVDYTDNGDGSYTIPGTDINADFTITVTRTKVEDTTTVEVEKPAWVTGSSTATKGQSYSFTVSKSEGYSYSAVKVTVDGRDITNKVTSSGDTYTIPGDQVTGKIVISITRTSALKVEVMPYITVDRERVMYLVTASGSFAEGYIAKYDGQSMYWSKEYNAYAWLVVSADNLQTVKTDAEKKIAMAQGTAAGTVVYTGDVNGTGNIDINDAQLTYDLYNAKYDSFTSVSMQKFLNADVNHDKLVDVLDASAVVAAIR